MKQTKLWMLATILTLCGTDMQAQMKRSDDFRARYGLKEVVVMSRHNIRSPLSSGAAYQRVTPYEWFAWSSPGSQLSLREGLNANADGLYILADLDAHIANAMAEYDAIEDVPTAVRSVNQPESASQPAAIYNLQGQRLDTMQRGVNIVGGTKNIIK